MQDGAIAGSYRGHFSWFERRLELFNIFVSLPGGHILGEIVVKEVSEQFVVVDALNVTNRPTTLDLTCIAVFRECTVPRAPLKVTK